MMSGLPIPSYITFYFVKLRFCILTLVCGISSSGCIWIPVPYPGYEFISLKAKVVDAESQQPIDGVKISWPIAANAKPHEYATDASGVFEARPDKRFEFGYTFVGLEYWFAPIISRAYTGIVYMKIEHEQYGVAYMATDPDIHKGWMFCNLRLREKMVDLGTLEFTAILDIQPAVYDLSIYRQGTGPHFEKFYLNKLDRSNSIASYRLDQIAEYEKATCENSPP